MENNHIIISQVEQILEIPAFGDTIELMKWEFFGRWLSSQSVEEREEIFAKLAGVLEVQAKFTSMVQNAEYDAKNQETEQ